MQPLVNYCSSLIDPILCINRPADGCLLNKYVFHILPDGVHNLNAYQVSQISSLSVSHCELTAVLRLF